MDNSVSSTRPLVSRKAKVCAAGLGFLSTTILSLFFLSSRYHTERSAFTPFREIKLTISQAQMEDVLRDQRVIYHWSGTSPDRAICQFTDFWREYRIVLDPKTRKVVRKSFGFKRSRFLRLSGGPDDF
jgi:hypothetical protein